MQRALVGGPRAADWAMVHGRSALTSAELAELLKVPVDQVRRRLHVPAIRGEWVMPVRGLWVPVPPEFRTWGAPPGIELIEAMMDHLGVSYYVGWLTAAGLYGAAHQAPQVFQVAVERQVRDRSVGRTRFAFAQRNVASIPTVAWPTRSGTARVSTPAATALDVAADVDRSGGLDNAATVIVELAETDTFDLAELIGLAPSFPAAAGRRVGWILERFSERFAGSDDLDPLQASVHSLVGTPSRLGPTGAASGEVDRRWQLYLNRELEPDT